MDKNRQQSSDFYRLITETVRIYLGKSLNEFQTSLQLVGMSEIQARKSLLRLYFSWYLPARTECNYKTEPFLLLCAKTKSFREKLLCAIVSTFLFFMFVDQLLLVDADLCQKTTMADFRYIWLKSWKIDNIALTQQFSLWIFTDYRYQSIKITWLLPIFIDWLLREYTTHVSI